MAIERQVFVDSDRIDVALSPPDAAAFLASGELMRVLEDCCCPAIRGLLLIYRVSGNSRRTNAHERGMTD
jgi:hypothetical protein